MTKLIAIATAIDIAMHSQFEILIVYVLHEVGRCVLRLLSTYSYYRMKLVYL